MKSSARVALLLVAASCRHAQIPLPATSPSAATASVARGEYLVRNVGVCGGCHSGEEKNPDGPLSGGREFRDWRIGIARASNLTADVDTGLGAWTDAEIVRAIRNGQSRNGRLLAPVMPYEWFHEMSDDDAFAIARYLKSVPPVRNDVRQSPNLAFKFAKLIMLRPLPAIAVSAPAPGVTPEYGSYLSQHTGLCAECHTPRSGLRSAPDKTRLLAGAPNPPKEFPAKPSNLTPDLATGIGRWSEADFVQTIRSGTDPAGHALHPFMPWRQNRRMSDDDLRAIYAFLRTLPPIRQVVVNRDNAR
jgi:mono/diheme cytochrome c family protein